MMTERSTQIALVVVGVLLGAHLLRFAPILAVQDEEAPEPDGEAILRIRDPEGDIRVKLGASQSGSGLVLLNDRTEPGVQMRAGADGATITLAERGKGERVIAP